MSIGFLSYFSLIIPWVFIGWKINPPLIIDKFSGSLLNDSQNLREDVQSESLDREEVIKLAPESDGVYFKVPKVIKEEEEWVEQQNLFLYLGV